MKDFILSKETVRTLMNNGYQAYFVGGCVRDMFFNITPKDFDIVTDCPVDKVKSLFPFKSHGHITEQFLVHAFNWQGSTIEIATFRDEGTITNRNSLPKQGDINTDVLRRDFTINSLFWNPITFDIIDPSGFGIDDCKNRILRTTRDPEIVFQEDPIRILRGIRFMRKFRLTPSFDFQQFIHLVDWKSDRSKQEIKKIKMII